MQTSQISSAEIIANPETCNARHLVANGLAFGYEAARLGFYKYAEQAGHFQTAAGGSSAAAFLID